MKILIIDDDVGDRKTLRRLLTALPWTVAPTEAKSGREALACAEEAFDFIFLDNCLPGEAGIELIEELACRWPHTAVCLLTGQGSEELAKLSIQRGAVDYIGKAALDGPLLQRVIANGLKMAQLRSKLEDQRAELSVFSEVLVHDLKAPIRSIGFLLDKLEEDLGPPPTEDVREDLALLHSSNRRMRDLVDSLASHVRLDRDAVPDVTTTDYVAKSAEMALLSEIEATGAEIVLAGATLQLLCNVPQVIQLFQNLFGNSIKYAGNKAPRIRLDWEKEGQDIHFRVTDNGIGIPPRYRETIFEPFKRLPVSASVPGTGLGLATCAKIVKRHSGQIWCDPDFQDGSRIHVTLPDGLKALKRTA
ncbi:sensor histidine kinase [Chachezhania sediminis]|uniref:sensor histidine kinase n=1 Tax=Chachezhania sediminis TaxID=2599291 RepID=UPI00131DC82B|nr:hybrid sensor histidine kinase/response regulator [Chachezhania sediminis]